MVSDSNHVMRAQPWLGTFVEIRAEATRLSRWHVMSAIDAAFAEVATIHRLMSRQEQGSDLVRLAAADVGQVVPVDARTGEVLRLALELQTDSGGRFDPERPDHADGSRKRRRPGPAWMLDEPNAVRILRRATVDLDGIAKGYAVDRAIATLQSRGIAATVNAGGDLRTTEATDEHLLVRSPLAAGGLVSIGRLRAGAFATSQSSVSTGNPAELAGAGIHDRRVRKAALPLMSVSVAAATCAVADALTKVVAVDSDFAANMLERREATAWILREFDGELRMQRLGCSSVVVLNAA